MAATKTILALVALAAIVSFVDSAGWNEFGPCRANSNFGGNHYQECKDCTKGNYYTYYLSSPCCPQTGYCNALCYNCDSPCREPQGDWQKKNCGYNRKRSLPDDSSDVEHDAGELSLKDIMQMADTDKDGRLSYKELNLYMTNGTMERVEDDQHLIEMDLNGDGFLTVEEIDPKNEGRGG